MEDQSEHKNGCAVRLSQLLLNYKNLITCKYHALDRGGDMINFSLLRLILNPCILFVDTIFKSVVIAVACNSNACFQTVILCH